MSASEPNDIVRVPAERWLETELLPMALSAAGMDAATPARVLEDLRSQEYVRGFEAALAQKLFNAVEAKDFAEDLGAVAAAFCVARWADDSPRALAVRDAVVLLARLAAFELSNASELRQDADDALYPHGRADPKTLEREDVAGERFERWRALDGPVKEALFAWIKNLGADIAS